MAEEEIDYAVEIRRQAAADAAAFLTKDLAEGVSGIPLPPTIELTEVTADPVKFDILGFGVQGAATIPGGGGSGSHTPPSDGGPAHWACCVPAGCVDNKTLFECTELGGTLMIGQHCDADPCHVEGVGVACDVITATKYKCGYDGFFGDITINGMPKKYLTSTQVWNYTINLTAGGCSSSDNHIINGHRLPNDCSADPTYTCSGSRSNSSGCNNTWIDGVGTGGCTFTGGPSLCTFCCPCGPDSNDGGACTSDTACPNFRCVLATGSPCGSGATVGYIDDYYSDEYTDDQLIADTVAALPPYSGLITGACPSALRDLNPAFPSPVFLAGYKIRRFKYQFQFPSQSSSFTVYWNETGPDGINALSETMPPFTTEGAVHELLEPSVNGETNITDIMALIP